LLPKVHLIPLRFLGGQRSRNGRYWGQKLRANRRTSLAPKCGGCRRRPCSSVRVRPSRSEEPVVEFGLVGENVRLDVGRDRELALADPLADPRPPHPAQVERRDAPVAQVVRRAGSRRFRASKTTSTRTDTRGPGPRRDDPGTRCWPRRRPAHRDRARPRARRRAERLARRALVVGPRVRPDTKKRPRPHQAVVAGRCIPR
jgi:hypothetical protein